MKSFRYILIFTVLLLTSCINYNIKPENSVPMISSLFSKIEPNSVTLSSSINTTNPRIECGFYVGKNKNTLTQYSAVTNDDNVFNTKLTNLEEETVYWYKAYVTNGINEICTNLQSFETLKAPTIQPEPEPFPKPEPEPLPEPQPKPEFNVNFSNYIITKTETDRIKFEVYLSGEYNNVKNMWFFFGNNPNNLSTKVDAVISGNKMSGSTNIPKAGNYWVKAYISDNKITKESEATPFEIIEQDPQGPGEPLPEFNADVSGIKVNINRQLIELNATLSGDVARVKMASFRFGKTPYSLDMSVDADIDNNTITGYTSAPQPGTYWAKAYISNGYINKESELISFEVKETIY